MAAAEGGDPGIAGRGVELRERRALRELPGERVLACARPDQQHLHAASLVPAAARSAQCRANRPVGGVEAPAWMRPAPNQDEARRGSP